MPSNISIVIADPTRMPIIRERLRLPGQALHFTSGSLAPAIDNIRSYQPKLIAVDMLFAQTPSGMAFVARVEKAAAAESTIRFITCVDGKWVTVPRGPSAAVTAAAAAPVTSSGRPAIVSPAPIVVNTRRAPRFLVKDPLNAVVENVIPFFERFPFLSAKKKRDFAKFKQIVALMKEGAHLTTNGIRQILNIREDMNDGGKRRHAHVDILASLIESSETTRQASIKIDDDIVRSSSRDEGSAEAIPMIALESNVLER